MIYALIVFAIANIAFEVSQVFYNAMLPTIAPRDRLGRLSGWGWGLGYAGGLSCLMIALFAFVQGNPPLLGLQESSAEHVRIVGPMVAIWFAVFCIPLFLFVPDMPSAGVRPGVAAREGIATLISTVKRVRDYRDVAWFLLARVFYVDGMNTMFAFGGIYAVGTFDMTIAEVIQFGLALNVTAGLGAAGFAWLDDRMGAKRTIAIALTGLIALGIPLLLVDSKLWFWIVGVPSRRDVRPVCVFWSGDFVYGPAGPRAGRGRTGLSAGGHGDYHGLPRRRSVHPSVEGARAGLIADQCRKWRMPVNTIASPASSAALMTSSSRIDPPGWITAVAPASAADSRPSAKGKNASDATTEPLTSGSDAPAASAASSDLRAAIRDESTRLIWPAPMPTVAPSLA